MALRRFNIKIFLIAFPIISLLTFLTLLAAASFEETDERNIFIVILAKGFYLFRFPIHTFFGPPQGDFFFISLFLNVLLYCFLIERLWPLTIRKINNP